MAARATIYLNSNLIPVLQSYVYYKFFFFFVNFILSPWLDIKSWINKLFYFVSFVFMFKLVNALSFLRNLSYILDKGPNFRQEWLLGVWLESDLELSSSKTLSRLNAHAFVLDGYEVRRTKNRSASPSSLLSIPLSPFCDSYFPAHEIVSFLQNSGAWMLGLPFGQFDQECNIIPILCWCSVLLLLHLTN